MKNAEKILTVILVITILISLCAGRYPFSPEAIFTYLRNPAEPPMGAKVFFYFRLPRIILVAVSGGALALSGYVYQAIFQNPLVSGDVLGVTAGCSVGAIAAILAGGGMFAVQSGSFLAGIATVGICIHMAGKLEGNRTLDLILTGIVVGALANALIMLLKLSADPYHELPGIEFWLMGSFSSARWADVAFVSVPVAVAALLLYRLRYQIFVLSHGEEEAATLGIPVKRVRLLAIGASTVLISCVISVAGIVSWIGLIAPHVIRLLLKQPIHRSMGSAMICGGILLLWADTFARSVWSFEMPVSILTSVIGALFLWYLLVKRGVRL